MDIHSRLLVLVALIFFTHPALAEEHDQMSSVGVTPSTKILGGIEANQGDWPWMTALMTSSNSDMYQAQFCGGVLIDDTWVLTAAHCVTGKTAGEIDVAVGVFDLDNFSGSRIAVKNIRMHPDYNATNSQNDIALLELNQPSAQPPIVLFSGESQEEAPPSMLGRMLTAIGWGMVDGSSSWYWPDKLRQVNLPVVVDSKCNYESPLISSQICVGYYEAKDACRGDSGGPVVGQVDATWVHVGLVSYGARCDDSFGYYGVYTRTSAFVDFIKQYAEDAQFTSTQPAVDDEAPPLTWLQLLLN